MSDSLSSEVGSFVSSDVIELSVAEPKAEVASSRERVGPFEALVREHQDRVFDFCLRMLGDREEASDAAQEIFVNVHQNLEKFRRDAKVTTWLYRICKNHCLNRLKYLNRRGRGRVEALHEVEDAELNRWMAPAEKPDEALASAHERARVQRAISRLDEAHRLLVVLRDIEGLSYEEIVEITELPEGTVKSRLHRAREQLADLLIDEEAQG